MLAPSMLAPMTASIALAIVTDRAYSLEPPGFEPIGETSSSALDVSGSVDVVSGKMVLGNGSTVTARNHAVDIHLRRGGEVKICQTTSLHLAKDSSIHEPASTALMLALDRGAIEAHYTVGKYSDVLLTPDLRILVSGPGRADLSVRVNREGDTCVANHGARAPYVIVSSLMEGGAYRVMPNQRVIFEGGSLSKVVDNAHEPCGCPPGPPVNLARAASPVLSGKKPAHPVGGPSSEPQDTAFPLAESEGLAPPPKPPSQPVVPPGQIHVQVTVPFTYNGSHPPALPPLKPPEVAEAKAPAPLPKTAADQAPEAAIPPRNAHHRSPLRGFFGGIGHFFSRIFR